LRTGGASISGLQRKLGGEIDEGSTIDPFKKLIFLAIEGAQAHKKLLLEKAQPARDCFPRQKLKEGAEGSF